MRRVFSVLGIACVAAALVACSSGDKKVRHSTRGVVQPEARCVVDPRKFAEAEKVRDFEGGHGCGVRNAWRLHSVMGVRLSKPTIVNCATAHATALWIRDVAQPAADNRFGEKITELTVPAGYSCRPRNNVWGAKLSEHGMGNAIDISGFRLADGEYIGVEQGWLANRKEKKFVAEVRAGACGIFKTVLGPGADRHHDDHLHFDLQRHRSGGAYCR
jgi:hypothetical protein